MRSAGRWFQQRPLHHKLAIAGVIVLVIAALVVATTHIFGDNPGSGNATGQTPPLRTRLRIAIRFAPILKLDSKELLVPIDRSAYIADTQLEERKGNVDSVVNPTPTAATLPATEGSCKLVDHCFYFLNVTGAEPPRSPPRAYAELEKRALASGATERVYFHVSRYDSGEYTVQYWFLYFYNYRLNDHESDWEQITLHLDKDANPIEAFYSSHAAGQKRVWRKIQKIGDHPIVYVARGSHANYFTHGLGNAHIVTLDCRAVLRKRFCTGNATIRDHSDGKGPTLEVGRDYKVRELTGPVFVGSYGTGNYVLGKRKNDILSDPRTRPAWQDPLARFEPAKRV